MTTRSAFGAGLLVGELLALVMTEVLPRFVVAGVRRWL